MMKWFYKTVIAIVLVLSMVLPVLTPVAFAIEEAGSSGIKDFHSMTMDQILASKEELTWVIAGDSITHNASWPQGANAYSDWIEQYMYAIGRNQDSVINTGWGGADIQDFLYQKDTPGSTSNGAENDPGMGIEQFITKYNPDVITIKLGMNNRGMDTDTFVKYYNMMLDAIYAEGKKNNKIPKVIILTPSPIASELLEHQDMETQDSCWRFQKCLKKIAEERDLLFVDLMTAFTTKAREMGTEYRETFFVDPSDGAIHPNAAGQYLIFQTLSKTLGIYDESMPIYQLNYKDIIYAPLFIDGTYDVTYTVSASDPEVMDKIMPTVALTGKKLLSYVEFDRYSGIFGSANYKTGYTVDLTDANEAKDPLTLDELKTMSNEFTLVFRAKLGPSPKENQPVLSITTTNFENWSNALVLGVPGTADRCYYEIRLNGTEKTTNPSNQFTMTDKNATVDGEWHTVAIVQSKTSFTYYIDGKVHYTSTAITIPEAIGTIYKDATQVSARIGLYTDNASDYILNGNFDYWALYDGAMTAEEVNGFTAEKVASKPGPSNDDWKQIIKENNLWAMVGAEQLSGYKGNVVNRSLFRMIECAVRGGANRPTDSQRDIRFLNIAAPGFDVTDMRAALADEKFDVLFLLPEISQVYAEGYVHSQELVDAYINTIKAMLQDHADKPQILWTPLASNNATINGYIDDYADAIRKLAEEDSSILFFDANLFMNVNMSRNEDLLNNWFEEEMYISPLCATDLATSFIMMVRGKGMTLINIAELTEHNLRQSFDIRHIKGTCVRDYLSAGVSIAGEAVTLDVSEIAAKYPGIKLSVAVLPEYAAQNNHPGVWANYAAVTGNSVTFNAPWDDAVITIYGELDDYTYRFKDISLDVDVANDLSKPVSEPDGAYLDGLKVVGAPMNFDSNTTTYNVALYQYQSSVQILPIGHSGLTITVNGQTVKAGERSQLIPVEKTATVEVVVAYGSESKTYTLNLTRPEYPDIIITEIMQHGYQDYHAAGGDNYDLIEIYNTTDRTLNLLDYSIGFKKDYLYSGVTSGGNDWPLEFKGNDTAFQKVPTYTGINQITKYSTYWKGGSAANEQVTEIPFPAGSTMVIWIKFSPGGASDKQAYGEKLTYETLIQALTDTLDSGNYDHKTLHVPSMDQLVLAEVPVEKQGSMVGSITTYNKTTPYSFYIDNFNVDVSRGWLFILDKDAERHGHHAVTKDGDDIHSAAMFYRVDGAAMLSTVLYYNVDRGMSVIKNAEAVLDPPVTGYTSDVSGYMNLTTFGAIEYWQKPLDLSDFEAPTVVDNTKDGLISLSFTDNTDIRFMIVNVDTDNDGIYETILKKDYVYETSAADAMGVTADQTSAAFTYDLTSLGNVNYYGYVMDGNNNKTTFGPFGDLNVTVSADDAETDAEVEVEISVSQGDATIDLEESYQILDETGKVVGTLSGLDLTGKVTVANGKTVTVKGLPNGVSYTVKAAAPEGFKAIADAEGNVVTGENAVVELKLVAVPAQGGNGGSGSGSGSDGSGSDNTGTDDPGLSGGNGGSGSGSSGSGSGNGGNTDIPKTGNDSLQQMLIGLIVLVSAAAVAVTCVIGVKAKKISE